MERSLGQRVIPKQNQIPKKWKIIYTPSLSEIPTHKWCAISTLENSVIFFDPVRIEITFTMNMSILAHSIHSSPNSNNVICVCYEKEWFVYEISKYFKE